MKTIKLFLIALLVIAAQSAMAQSTVLINGTKVEGATSLADAITKAGITDSSLVTSVHYTSGTFAGKYDATNTTAFTGDGDWLTLRSLTNIDTLITDAGVTVSDMPAFELYDPHTHALATKTYYFCRKLTLLQMAELKSVGSYAFYTNLYESDNSGRRDLEKVDLAAVDSIATYAFYNCILLTSLSIPESRSIGSHAFEEGQFTSLTLNECTAIGDSAFNICQEILTVDAPKAITVGNSAFLRCKALTSITLPRAVTIGKAAFGGCENLKEVILPEAVTIEAGAFGGCQRVTALDIPKAKMIGDGAFAANYLLRSASLPMTESLGEYAFSECTRLTTVSIPKLTVIEAGTFSSCSKLVLADTTLQRIDSIGDHAFYDCSALTSFSLPKAQYLGYQAFENTAITKLTADMMPGITELKYCTFEGCRHLESVDLPEVDSLSDRVFYDCDALATVHLPKAKSMGIQGVEGYGTFTNCYSLTQIELPAAERLERRSFYNCQQLQSALLPKISTIGYEAFAYCPQLSSVSLPAALPEVMTNFTGTDSLSLFIVDEKGAKLTGDAYTTAAAAYKSDAGYDTATGKWHGLILTADNNPTAVEMPEVNGAVWSGEGCIYVRTDKQAALTVYNIGGQIVKQTVAKAGTAAFSGLASGIYAVQLGKESIKVFVK